MTFKSGITRTQIDYLLMKVDNKRSCKDCKVILSECLMIRHMQLVMDMEFKSLKRKKKNVADFMVEWWNLTSEHETKLSKKIKTESNWSAVRDTDKMRQEMADYIQRLVK